MLKIVLLQSLRMLPFKNKQYSNKKMLLLSNFSKKSKTELLQLLTHLKVVYDETTGTINNTYYVDEDNPSGYSIHGNMILYVVYALYAVLLFYLHSAWTDSDQSIRQMIPYFRMIMPVGISNIHPYIYRKTYFTTRNNSSPIIYLKSSYIDNTINSLNNMCFVSNGLPHLYQLCNPLIFCCQLLFFANSPIKTNPTIIKQ